MARASSIHRPGGQGVVESAIHLIQIQVACGCSGGLTAFAVTPLVNRFHQAVDFFGRQQTGRAVRILSIRSDIDYSDSVVCIEHGDGIAGTDFKPALSDGRRRQYTACVERAGEARNRIPNPLAWRFRSARDSDYGFPPTLRFHARAPDRSSSPDKFKRLGNHEATRSALLDGVTGGIEADRPNACLLKSIQDFVQVPSPCGTNVDIHLLGGECGPQSRSVPSSRRIFVKGSPGRGR